MSTATGFGPDHRFTLSDGREAWWVESRGDGRTEDQRCDNGHKVGHTEVRGWATDPEGYTTKASHNRPRKFYCEECFVALGAPSAPRTSRSWW